MSENRKDFDLPNSGGTDPYCIFDKLVELDLLASARAIIIITDGYFCQFTRDGIEVPVLWFISKGGTKAYLEDWDYIAELDIE